MMKTLVSFAAVFVCLGSPAAAQMGSFGGSPIHYMTTEVHDPVAQLAEKLSAGELKLAFDPDHGYLPSVLRLLDVPVSSQTLVFSKTSLQLHRISPRRPRALYFNDDVYVGWCQQGEVLELAATDPQQGATFYTLKQSDDQRPEIMRDQGVCLSCHASNRTQDVPGYLVRSVFTDFAGRPVFNNGTFTTDQTSPFRERWGGWYVTGDHGDMRHMGNVLYDQDDGELDFETGANLESLSELVSTRPYLTPHSDIVAMMVLGHQSQMHNAIAAANYEVRRALHQSFQMNELLERPKGHISESAARRINRSVDRVLQHLLMCDEFELQSSVKGTSGFQREFESRGFRDQRDRSLRDFDLQTRLFRYPCSYLIHSPAFDGLPDEVRARILIKLRAILEGNEPSEDYPHLTPTLRRQILEILEDTKPEFKKVPA